MIIEILLTYLLFCACIFPLVVFCLLSDATVRFYYSADITLGLVIEAITISLVPIGNIFFAAVGIYSMLVIGNHWLSKKLEILNRIVLFRTKGTSAKIYQVSKNE